MSIFHFLRNYFLLWELCHQLQTTCMGLKTMTPLYNCGCGSVTGGWPPFAELISTIRRLARVSSFDVKGGKKKKKIIKTDG